MNVSYYFKVLHENVLSTGKNLRVQINYNCTLV